LNENRLLNLNTPYTIEPSFGNLSHNDYCSNNGQTSNSTCFCEERQQVFRRNCCLDHGTWYEPVLNSTDTNVGVNNAYDCRCFNDVVEVNNWINSEQRV